MVDFHISLASLEASRASIFLFLGRARLLSFPGKSAASFFSWEERGFFLFLGRARLLSFPGKSEASYRVLSAKMCVWAGVGARLRYSMEPTHAPDFYYFRDVSRVISFTRPSSPLFSLLHYIRGGGEGGLGMRLYFCPSPLQKKYIWLTKLLANACPNETIS